MKKFLVQIILLIIVIGAGIFLYLGGNNQNLSIPFLPQPAKISNLQIKSITFKVEVADTPTRRSKGLGGRQGLEELEGMLFIFDKVDKHPFWMKGLTFPLDFIWIRDDAIVDILPNIKPPQKGLPDSSLPIYTSKVAADKVLEVNAGTSQKYDIKAGDLIKLTPL